MRRAGLQGEAGGMKGGDGGEACLQILYRTLQPPIRRFPGSTVAPSTPCPSRSHHRRLALPSAPGARAGMVRGRAAGGARQIRELHCQAGMIYLTNISI